MISALHSIIFFFLSITHYAAITMQPSLLLILKCVGKTYAQH